MWKRLFFVVCMLPYAGCGGIEEFPRAAATGTVTCEGKGVAKAIVYFEPLMNGNSAVAGKQGFGLTDENGKFVISTYGENDGAVIGKHKVRVGRSEGTPKCDCALIPDEPLMEVEVKSDIENNFDLVLHKASAVDRKREEELKKRMEN